MCIPKRMYVVCHRGAPRGRTSLYAAEADSKGISRLIVATLGCCEVYRRRLPPARVARIARTGGRRLIAHPREQPCIMHAL